MTVIIMHSFILLEILVVFRIHQHEKTYYLSLSCFKFKKDHFNCSVLTVTSSIDLFIMLVFPRKNLSHWPLWPQYFESDKVTWACQIQNAAVRRVNGLYFLRNETMETDRPHDLYLGDCKKPTLFARYKSSPLSAWSALVWVMIDCNILIPIVHALTLVCKSWRQ